MKKLLKWIAIIFIVLIIIGVVSGSGKSGNNQKTVSNENTQKEKQVEEPTKITARELADDFESNQVAAENKWKDKLVEFSAVITNITDSGLSFSNVTSKEFSLTQISCRIKDKQQLLPLKKEQSVTVRGVVGDQTIGVIDVSDCSVVQ